MNGFPVKLILLAARAVAIAYASFLLALAFDVFGGGQRLGVALSEFVIHASPSLLLAFVLAITWRRPRLAGILMIACGVIFTVFFQTYRSWSTLALLTLPLVVSGGLFLLESRTRKPSA